MKMVRSYFPGSEWVYFKIYLGVSTSDDILLNLVSPIMKKAMRKSWIDKWFFIRYSDPDYHIRLRFHLTDLSKIGDLIVEINRKSKKYIDNHLIYRISIDTYQREIERYGDRQMEMSESLFFVDSVFVCNLIPALSDMPDECRWEIALYSIDAFLSVFGQSYEQKYTLMKRLSAGYKKEFGFNEHNSKALNSLYRDNRKLIERAVSGIFMQDNFDSFKKLVRERDYELSKYISGNANATALDIPSCLHMMMNRLFQTSNREMELVLYSFLTHEYDSIIHRVKNQKT